MSKEESATDQHVRAAEVSEMFSLFCGATSQRQILGLYWSMCEKIGIRPGPFTEFYPKLRSMVSCWKAESLWKKLDNRASQRVYNGGKAAIKTRVLIIGAGPCACGRRLGRSFSVPKWSCWRSATESAATTCCTCGRSSSTT